VLLRWGACSATKARWLCYVRLLELLQSVCRSCYNRLPALSALLQLPVASATQGGRSCYKRPPALSALLQLAIASATKGGRQRLLLRTTAAGAAAASSPPTTAVVQFEATPMMQRLAAEAAKADCRCCKGKQMLLRASPSTTVEAPATCGRGDSRRRFLPFE
jgi:hypothetical protein